MPKYIDVSKVSIPKGFFEQDLNVPKLLNWLNDQPEAEVVPVVHAQWKRVKWMPKAIEGGGCMEGGYLIVRCTNCSIPNDTESRYCPNCGAIMVEE